MSLHCPCCGREWRDADHMRAETTPIGLMAGCDGWLELANCTCTNSRVVEVHPYTRPTDLDDCPPTLRDPGLHPAAPGIRDAAAGAPDSRE